MSTRMVHGKWVVAVLLGAVPLVAQNAPPNATPGVRRPGGGAGLDYKAYDATTLDDQTRRLYAGLLTSDRPTGGTP